MGLRSEGRRVRDHHGQLQSRNREHRLRHFGQAYFEPLTLEDVLEIVRREKPEGVVVQFGGQTPLKLAVPLWNAGVPIIGTSPDAIDRAEDRKRFKEMLISLGLNQPPNDIAHSLVKLSRSPDA